MCGKFTRQRLWLLKKSFMGQKRPSASSFKGNLSERVFQQPRQLSTIIVINNYRRFVCRLRDVWL
jgi:hypothetical protein